MATDSIEKRPVRIGKRTVDDANPTDKDRFIWDEDISGFGLKITPAGGKVYVYQYRISRPGAADRTPPKRYTIGKHGSLTPDQARKSAKYLASLVSQGICPKEQEGAARAAKDEAERQAQERARLEGDLAFEKIAALWLDHYENEKDRRPSSVRMARLVVNKHLQPKLMGKPMPHIGRADLQPIIDAIPVKQRGMRRSVFAYASVLFGWASKRGDIPSNPLSDMAKPEAPRARDRVLTDDELAALWKGTVELSEPFGSFFRLLILTGQRRSEVAAINWAELDRATATWTIPADRAKNGVAHIVPLSPEAKAELDRLAKVGEAGDDGREIEHWPKTGYVLTTTGQTPISGFTKAKNALDAQVKKDRDGKALDAWRIHDLRRSVATGFQRLGIRFEVTEAVLNHVSGAKGGIAGIYQRHDWKEEKRSALAAWARHIADISKPADKGNVVPLDRAKGAA
ncbi:MAG: integrase arm-type DNA-binding domain-containing protein [Sphingomonadaceae bacterium]|nr:integrase arm-type DNA-binding domain-containing protein [Sphingomonadaceae bacterium]